MAPIRIGILGLSPGSWADNAHLPYLTSPESKFQIVAVCNSSARSAEKAIADLKLKGEVKAYGNPQDLADDKDIDLIVCTVRVDRHHATILPALKAGKNVFVEWPLGKNLQVAEELAALAKDNKVKINAVGLQGRFDSVVQTLKKTIDSGRIGKVLSSTVTGVDLAGGPTATQHYQYLVDREVGGHTLTISFIHLIDTIHTVLGEFKTFTSLLSNQRKTVTLLNSDNKVVQKDLKKTSPDQIYIQGELESGAVFGINIKGGPPFKDTPGLEWRIVGEKGEIKILSAFCHIQVLGASSIELFDFEKDTVEKIEPVVGAPMEDWNPAPRNVGRVYEAIAAGNTDLLCSFEGAIKRHKFIDEIYKQNPNV